MIFNKKKKDDTANQTNGTRKKPKKKGKIIAIVIAAIVVVGIVYSMIPKEVEPLSVACATASISDVQVTIDSNGTVTSGEEKTYFSPVSAKINEVPYKVGDAVSIGDLLLSYDQEDLDTQYQTAELNGTASEYTYLDSVNKSNQASSDLSTLSGQIASLEQQVADKENQIASLQSQINGAAGDAKDSYNNQVAEIQNEQKSLNAESLKLSKKAIDVNAKVSDFTAKITAAQTEGKDTAKYQEKLEKWTTKAAEIEKRQLEINARLTELTTKMSSIETSTDTSSLETQLSQAQTDLSKLQTELSTKEGEKATAENTILTNEAVTQMAATSNAAELSTMTTLDLIKKAQTGITADFNGIITNITAVSGSTSTQGAELITVASTDDVKIVISVSKYNIEAVEVGQTAEVTILNNTYNGTVTKVNKLASKSEKGNITFEAEVTLDTSEKDLYLGIEGSVKIKGQTAKNVITVPSSAINTDTEGDFCYVVEDSIIVKKPVTIGIASNDTTEVSEGIGEGDTVITDVTDAIIEGIQVTPNLGE